MRTLFRKILDRPFLTWLIFFALAFVVYGVTLDNYFLSDDWHWFVIGEQRAINIDVWLSNYEGIKGGGSYNPILFLIYKLFFSIFGTKHFWYHFVSVAIHGINAFLVFVLAKQVFGLSRMKSVLPAAFTSGLLFLIWPTHVEVVTWTAAWAHLWPVTFYLLSLIGYFAFVKTGSRSSLWLSGIFFVVALFTKEIAMSLPFVIIAWELYSYLRGHNEKYVRPFIRYYFYALLAFLILRFAGTGMLFGYYGRPTLGIDIFGWIAHIGIYLGELVSFGFLRELMFKVHYHYGWLLAIVVILAALLYFAYLYGRKQLLNLTALISFLLISVPFLLVSMHRNDFADERYLYLPSVFFLIFIVSLFSRWKWFAKLKVFVLVALIVVFASVIIYKNSIWQEASDLSQQVVESYAALDLDPGQKLIAVAMPDNLSGAQVYRNNLQQALYYAYPDNYPSELKILWAYVEVTPQNKNEQLLKWRRDELGWFAESVDGSFVVTGITSVEAFYFYWELWNYNYQNYTANTIRLMPQGDELKSQLASGEIKVITFDEGKLRLLDY